MRVEGVLLRPVETEWLAPLVRLGVEQATRRDALQLPAEVLAIVEELEACARASRARRLAPVIVEASLDNRSQRERRRAVAEQLAADPDRSDRTIGKLAGVDHKTVGRMRRMGNVGEIRAGAAEPVQS